MNDLIDLAILLFIFAQALSILIGIFLTIGFVVYVIVHTLRTIYRH